MKLLHVFIVALLLAAYARAAEPATDLDTVLLLRFDGGLLDESGCGNDGAAVGPVDFAPGRGENKVLLLRDPAAPAFHAPEAGGATPADSSAIDELEGKKTVVAPAKPPPTMFKPDAPKHGIVTVRGSGSLFPGGGSWTVEAWIKPDKKQAPEAVIVAANGNEPMSYGLRLMRGALARFDAGSPCAAMSVDISDKLFDGQWHHVAAVLDRAHGGEIRVVLDGEVVNAEPASQPRPLRVEGEAMDVAIGGLPVWMNPVPTVPFDGAIAEVRISRVAREFKKE